MNLDILYMVEKQSQRVEQRHRAKNLPAVVRFFSQEYREAMREGRNAHENTKLNLS